MRPSARSWPTWAHFCSPRRTAHVRLDEVADVYREEASNLIVRDNTRRKALISCNVAPGSNVGDLVAALREHVEPVVHAHGCTVSYGGSYEAQQSASRRLTWLAAGLLLVIVLLLGYALDASAPRWWCW